MSSTRDLRNGFDSCRALLANALDWDYLFNLADRIYHDRRLSWPEKDRLFTILDGRERAMGGPAVRCLQASASRTVLANA